LIHRRFHGRIATGFTRLHERLQKSSRPIKIVSGVGASRHCTKKCPREQSRMPPVGDGVTPEVAATGAIISAVGAKRRDILRQ
jgi:hypothetical protein